MQVYLVGGAVRDALLGLPIKERDWVVVGGTAQAMLKQGYQQVGKDFPVFLHPKSKEEYALARTERKTGHGYDGFVVHAEASVTLEEDLRRRDLTINAIAKDQDGKIIDFFGGVNDLHNKVLRHVSEAFVEDPLRLVRLCRFQARFTDFTIHASTQALCCAIVQKGEVDYLTPERVWLEWQKVFSSPAPEQFIACLQQFGAWSVLMPGFDQVELDMQYIKQARQCMQDQRLFCVLGWYLHPVQRKKQLQALRLPKALMELAVMTQSIALAYGEKKITLSAEALLRQLQQWDVFRRYERFAQACEIVQAVLGVGSILQHMLTAAEQLAVIKPDLGDGRLSGEAIAQNLQQRRLQALADLMEKWKI